MTKNLKIIVFGSEQCPQCMKQKSSFQFLGVPFQFVDAMAADNQSLCDRMDVDELPHSICFFDDSMKPVHSHRGFVEAQSFMNNVVERLSGGVKKSFNPGIRVNRASPDQGISDDFDLLK